MRYNAGNTYCSVIVKEVYPIICAEKKLVEYKDIGCIGLDTIYTKTFMRIQVGFDMQQEYE